MPLEKGRGRAVIRHNIEEMEASGHPHRVAVAAALNTAHYRRKRNKRKKHTNVGESYTGRYY